MKLENRINFVGNFIRMQMFDIDMDMGPIRREAKEGERELKMGQLILVGDVS